MLPSKIAFVDIETTGTSLSGGRIIEIGVVRVENNKVVDQFQTLLNPHTHLPSDITNLTGITPDSLNNAPSFSTIAKDLHSLLKDCVFSAHNVRFDYGFVKQEFAREEISYQAKNLCTVKLSRALFPRFKHHNLDALLERFEIECKNRHRAFDDAYSCWQFYQKLPALFPEEKLDKAIAKVMRRPSVPVGLSEKMLDSLPETAGVYIFYGKAGMPLYVGKSINIQGRVKDHFASDHLSAKEMQLSQQVTSIESIVTSGELGALIKEAALVKSLQPLYNRQLRHARNLTTLQTKEDEDGYLRTTLIEVETIHPSEAGHIMGVFRNLKSAKQFLAQLAKEQGLCEKLLGIEKTKGACFGHRLGRCQGACLGEEKPALYNTRLNLALSAHRIKDWPFAGAIGIDEKDPVTNLGERHIFDQWCYLGKQTYHEDDPLEEFISDVTFDMDTYKILRRFLASPLNQKKIHLIQSSGSSRTDF